MIGRALAIGFLPLALLVRCALEERAYDAGLASLISLGRFIPAEERVSGREQDFLPLLPGWVAPPPLPGPAVQAAEAESARERAKVRVVQNLPAPPVLPEPSNAKVPSARILEWANQRLVPVGRGRGAGYGLPAGIELSNVNALGIGLLDGDRLVSVNGVGVQERAQVISIVLGARGRRERTIVATLWRRTSAGARMFTVTMEQPYLTPSPELAPQ